MPPIEKALWFIESRLNATLDLTRIAKAAGVSRHHLARGFAATVGMPLMRYVRARRLTEAARLLAAGAPDILALAIEAGYSSHEAFTRAFRDLFGLTPEEARARRSLQTLHLVERFNMEQIKTVTLDPPRLTVGQPMLIAGLADRFTMQRLSDIPGLWQKFGPHIGHVPNQTGDAAYGVMHGRDAEGAFTYLAGVEVNRRDGAPKEFSFVQLPAQKYAVFSHRAHISAIRHTFHAIYNEYLPKSGLKLAEAPDFERYGPEFNPLTGMGLVEIWVPIQG